ncbi:MAG: hypothetical protein JJU00_14805 [Opitutales bacterium]|nr:hypothetical protein [Opitutales bacterium]
MPSHHHPNPEDPIAKIAAEIMPTPRLLAPKELAYYLNRHVNFVYLMRKAGFPMPANRATLESALRWIDNNPDWRTRVDPPRKRRPARK